MEAGADKEAGTVLEIAKGREPDYSSEYLDCWNCEIGEKAYRLLRRRIKDGKGLRLYEERVEVKEGDRWNLIWRRRV
jgi:hypothetical protein